MKIGIIGAGAIGGTLTRKLSANGHHVIVANSRGPESIGKELLAFGAKAGSILEAISEREVLIISIPFAQMSNITAEIKTNANPRTVIIDTGNYYPVRDGMITDIENGKPESVWVSSLLERPVVKAWNAIAAPHLKQKGYPSGMPGRLALPLAADADNDKQITSKLVEETGFDAVDAGSLAKSWRFQPGNPPT